MRLSRSSMISKGSSTGSLIQRTMRMNLAGLGTVLGLMGAAAGPGAGGGAALAQSQLLQATAPPVWNIRPDAHQAVARHTHAPLDFFGWDDEDAEDDGYEVTSDGVAIIRVCGVLVDAEPSWWMSYLGYASTPLVTRQVKEAATNQNVKKIVLYLDSPGGSVSGLADACDAVWQVRQDGLEVYAICKQTCSAAFEIASQTKRIYLTQDGMSGCIGTLYTLRDWSGYYAQMGIVTYAIASDGAEKYKGEGTHGLKLTDAHQADFKRLCNEYRTLFNGIIQRGRGWDDVKMLALADGRVHVGSNALALGIVDEIATVEDALSKIGAGEVDVEGEQTPPPDSDEDDTAEDRAPLNDNPQDALVLPDSTSTSLEMLRNSTDAVETTPENTLKEQQMKLTMEDVINFLKGGGAQQEQSTTTEGTTTAGTAGTETPEAENTRLKAENANLTAFRDGELAQAKTDAKNAAVQAFGQGTPELKNAQTVIDSLTDVAAVRGYGQTLAKSKPTALAGTGARQSQDADAAPAADATTETDAEFFDNLRKEQATQQSTQGNDRQERLSRLSGKKVEGR